MALVRLNRYHHQSGERQASLKAALSQDFSTWHEDRNGQMIGWWLVWYLCVLVVSQSCDDPGAMSDWCPYFVLLCPRLYQFMPWGWGRFASQTFAKKAKYYALKKKKTNKQTKNMNNAKCRNFFYSVFGPLSPLFFLTVLQKKKKKKIGLHTKGYVAKVSPHTYASWFVRQIFLGALRNNDDWQSLQSLFTICFIQKIQVYEIEVMILQLWRPITIHFKQMKT